MRKFLDLAHTGVEALLLHPLRSLTTAACLVVVLVPYLAGVGLAGGIEREAEDAIRFGPDLYVTAQEFGRTSPIPLSAVAQVERIDGVTAVTPRIVGRVTLGKDAEEAVLVGMPPDRLPAHFTCVEGALPARGVENELVVGTELARRLRLHVGSLVPPFYHSRKGDRVSQVVGLFRSDVSLWQAHVIFTTFDTAAAVFDQEGLATGLLVQCRPGYQGEVRSAILRALGPPVTGAPGLGSVAGAPGLGPVAGAPGSRGAEAPGSAGADALGSPGGAGRFRPEVVGREDLRALLPSGLLHREGIFTLHFLLAFAVGILAVLVTSGFGLSERRREIGILKATGWQTDEVLLRGLVESLLLSLAGASASLLLAFVWLRGFNGYGVAGLFLAGAGPAPAFPVPFRLTPLPALFAFLIAVVVILTGTLYPSWRAATAPPREAMR